jgi:hypothetical protein
MLWEVVEPAERRTAWSHVAIVIDFLIGAIALSGALFLDLHLVARIIIGLAGLAGLYAGVRRLRRPANDS